MARKRRQKEDINEYAKNVIETFPHWNDIIRKPYIEVYPLDIRYIYGKKNMLNGGFDEILNLFL